MRENFRLEHEPRFGLEKSIILSMESIGRWAIEAGIVTGELPNYRDFIAEGPLQAVSPNSVHLP